MELESKEYKAARKYLMKKSTVELVNIVLEQQWVLNQLQEQIDSAQERNSFDPSAHRSVGGITVPRGMS